MGKSYGTRTAWKPRGHRTWENQKTCKSRKQKNKPKEPQNFETTWDAPRNEPKPLLQKHAFSALQNYQSGAFQNEAPPITDNTKRLHPPIFWFGPQPLHNASQTPPSRVGKVDLHALTCWDPRMSFSASIDSTLGQAHMLHASETPPISLALALPLRHSDWMQSISGHTSIILEGIHAFALDTQSGKIGQPASFKSSYGPHHTKGYPCLENSTTIGHSVTDHSTVYWATFKTILTKTLIIATVTWASRKQATMADKPTNTATHNKDAVSESKHCCKLAKEGCIAVRKSCRRLFAELTEQLAMSCPLVLFDPLNI